jgi:hypothetical protein
MNKTKHPTKGENIQNGKTQVLANETKIQQTIDGRNHPAETKREGQRKAKRFTA